MLNVESIRSRIQSAFPDARVEVRDLTGGGDHWDVVVVSDAFRGKRPVQRHQLVYGVFREELASGVMHALALKTWTPDQWEARQGG